MGNDSKRREEMLRSALSTSGFDIAYSFSLAELDDSVMEHLPVEDSTDKMMTATQVMFGRPSSSG